MFLNIKKKKKYNNLVNRRAVTILWCVLLRPWVRKRVTDEAFSVWNTVGGDRLWKFKKNLFQVDIIIHYYLVLPRTVKISNYRAERALRRDVTTMGCVSRSASATPAATERWWEVAFNQITIPVRNFHMNMVARADVTVVCDGSMTKRQNN